MSAATTVTATFAPIQFALTVTPSGTGTGTVTSSPAGINCGATCVASYNTGTVVTLTAAPAAGIDVRRLVRRWLHRHRHLRRDTVSAATTVTATFTAIQFALTVSKAGTGTGTVTSSPAGINCGATCVASYNTGTVVTLSAAPAAGSTLHRLVRRRLHRHRHLRRHHERRDHRHRDLRADPNSH